MLRDLVKQGKWKNIKDLFKSINTIGKTMMKADPLSFFIGNTVKRVLHIIREECKVNHIDLTEKPETSSSMGTQLKI
jgi:translation initiation factor 2B subunit (eIF-2B alpha/beta/delta family)